MLQRERIEQIGERGEEIGVLRRDPKTAIRLLRLSPFSYLLSYGSG
jgi:hypothetical protein